MGPCDHPDQAEALQDRGGENGHEDNGACSSQARPGFQLSPTKIKAYKTWRASLRKRIRQHRFARSTIMGALEVKDPLQKLRELLPADARGIERIAKDENLQRVAIARYHIIKRLSEDESCNASFFSKCLCITPERIRQLRKNTPITLMDLGIVKGRKSKMKVPEWTPMKRPKALAGIVPPKDSEKNERQRFRIRLAILALAGAAGSEGISTYQVNMAFGNSDLPSRNIEWLLVELASQDLLQCKEWTDRKRKRYLLTPSGSVEIADRGVEALGVVEFLSWLENYPRQKRSSGVPQGAPRVEIEDRGVVHLIRTWVGLPVPPTIEGGIELSEIYRRRKAGQRTKDSEDDCSSTQGDCSPDK
jgi:hypothetical protein